MDGAAKPISGAGSFIVAYDIAAETYLLLDNSTYTTGTTIKGSMLALASGAGYNHALLGSKTAADVVVMLPEDEPSSIEGPDRFKLGDGYDLWLCRGDSSYDHLWDVVYDAVYRGIAKQSNAATGQPRTVQCTFSGGRYLPGVEPDADLIDWLVSLTPSRYEGTAWL